MDDFKLSIFIILFPRPWCFYEEFNKLNDDFEQQQKLIINSSETQLIASLADGRKEIVDVQGLLDFRSTIAVVRLDLLEDQKEVAIIKGLNLLTRCPEVEPPSCTAEQQSAQLNSIEELYERLVEGKELLSDVISFPTVLHAIQLCDGSIAYVLADHLDQVEGPYNPLSTIDIPTADAVFAVLTRVNGPNQLFALELDYEANGNIEKATWKTTYHTPKYYRYRYDPLNRITSAKYGDVNATSVNPGIAQDMFSVQNITYDAIGNILSLSRFGTTGCDDQGQMENGLIDKLTYRYPEPPTDPSQPAQVLGSISQLMSIQDGAELNGLAVQGFNAGTASEDAIYRYDGAGRMTNDPYKGLTITYNHLDLPEKIATPTGDISILYDATGRKWLQKTANETRMYVGGMEFVKDGGKFILESANTGDGRLVVAMNAAQSSADGSPQNEKSSSGNIYAEYHHKDHLGNVRVAFTDRNDDHLVTLLGTANDIEVTQQLDYYPFGLQQQGQGLFHTQQEPGNRYGFNGIEHSEETGLDLAPFRSYDAAIGRWTQVDPMAEFATHLTPYRFGFNNPLRYIDPWGLFESRRAAREYRRQENRAARERGEKHRYGNIRRNKNGTFRVSMRGSDGAVTQTSSGSLSFSATSTSTEAPRGTNSLGLPNLRATDFVSSSQRVYTNFISKHPEFQEQARIDRAPIPPMGGAGAMELIGGPAGGISLLSSLVLRVPKGQKWIKLKNFYAGLHRGQLGGTYAKRGEQYAKLLEEGAENLGSAKTFTSTGKANEYGNHMREVLNNAGRTAKDLSPGAPGAAGF